MATFVQHEPCPSCGSRDNLGRYDDGGAYCWGCHYKEPRTHTPMRHMGSGSEEFEKYHKPLPEDIGHGFSPECVEWLSRFYVDVPTAIKNELYWSPSYEQLIYKLGNCWQARNFSDVRRPNASGKARPHPKNYTSGDVNECLHIYSMAESGRSPEAVALTIVEDPISALRIGSQSDAMPLLGSHLASGRLNAVARLYSSLIFWLDSDKMKEAHAMARRAGLMGLSTRVIWTPLDPKEYSDLEIGEFLNVSQAPT